MLRAVKIFGDAPDGLFDAFPKFERLHGGKASFSSKEEDGEWLVLFTFSISAYLKKTWSDATLAFRSFDDAENEILCGVITRNGVQNLDVDGFLAEEARIVSAALSDPDCPPLTDEELQSMVRACDIPGRTLAEKHAYLRGQEKRNG